MRWIHLDQEFIPALNNIELHFREPLQRLREQHLLGLCRHSAPAEPSRRPGEGHVPAGRVAVHIQRAGHAALDGTGAVQAGDLDGVV